MSRATTRAAVLAWLAPPNVAGLNTVFRSFEAVFDGGAFTAGTTGVGGGAIGVVFIPRKTEKRIAVGGAFNGKKRIDYPVEIHVFGRWNAEQFSGQTAMDAFDAVIDGIETRIRSDRTFGSSVWVAGEDLSGEYGAPALLDGMQEIWGVVRFTITEWANA